MKRFKVKGILKMMQKAEELGSCGNCCTFYLREMKVMQVLIWFQRYETKPVGFGVCKNEVYLEDYPRGIEVREDELVCGLYYPRNGEQKTE